MPFLQIIVLQVELIYELILLDVSYGFMCVRQILGCDHILLEPMNINTVLRNLVINQRCFGSECSIDRSCARFATQIYWKYL